MQSKEHVLEAIKQYLIEATDYAERGDFELASVRTEQAHALYMHALNMPERVEATSKNPILRLVGWTKADWMELARRHEALKLKGGKVDGASQTPTNGSTQHFLRWVAGCGRR